MAEQKRRWGDRRDATLLRDVDSLHFIMGIIYPNRADNEAYIAERVNLRADQGLHRGRRTTRASRSSTHFST